MAMSEPIMSKLFPCIFAAVLLFLCQYAYGLESDQFAPIELEANTVNVDSQNKTATYSGEVRLKQGSINIKADKIVITTNNKKVERAVITGDLSPATFSQEIEPGRTVQGQAKKITLIQSKQEISFQGNALVVDGNHTIEGQLIRYNSAAHEIIATSNNANDPVRMIFQPSSVDLTGTHLEESP